MAMLLSILSEIVLPREDNQNYKIIRAIRLSNITVIENLATKFKVLMVKLLKNKILKLK